MITTVTAPVIAGTEAKLEEDDAPVMADDCITMKIKCYLLVIRTTQSK